MKAYLDLLRHVRDHGTFKSDRTGTGTYSVFGHQMRFDLSAGFPLVTTKRVPFRLIVHELLWFLQGSTNIKYLTDHNVHIWDEWADENGELGPVYGSQWRSWPTPDGGSIDQIARVVDSIQNSMITEYIEKHPTNDIDNVEEMDAFNFGKEGFIKFSSTRLFYKYSKR